MNATVDSLRFFEGGNEPTLIKDREYNRFFKANTTRYIRWQLNLSHPIRYSDTELSIHAQWFDEDGGRFYRKEASHTIPKSWTASAVDQAYGTPSRGGYWDAGTYEVDLYVEGNLIARGSFEIYD
jgi:hypothetical protein